MNNPYPFWLLGFSDFPKELKQVCSDSKTGRVKFVWRDIECEQVNGILLGYEVKLYYDKETYTESVIESVNSYTILPQEKHKFLLPKAISVAAISELGVGDHSPPVNINSTGLKKLKYAKKYKGKRMFV